MRKLLLTLVACIVAIAANAGTLYLVGSGTVDGKSLGGSPNGNCLAITSANNVYTFNVNNVSWLKISDTNASDWATFNKNGFTISGKGDYAIKASELGQTFNLWYSNGSSEGTNNINPPSSGEYTYTITVGSKGASNSTLVVTAKSEEVITYDIYLRGSFNSYGVSADYKFTPDSKGEVYTLKGVTLTEGTKFKIADADWGAINYGNGQYVNANTYYTLAYNGNDMTLNQDINNATITFNTVSEQMYIDDPTAEPDVPITPNYSNYWIHVGGSFNSNDFYNNGEQPVDGIATFTNQAIGDGTFKIHVWNGSDDIYYIMDNADGDVQVPTGEWVQFVEDGYDIYDYVKGATANSVYDVKYDVATNKIYLTLVSGGTEEPGDEITELYVIGNFEGNDNWQVPGKAMTDEGDGFFTIENLTLNAGDGYGYFALTTNGTNNWGQINANRMSPANGDVALDAQLNQEVEVENVTKNSGNGSWKVPAGIYTLTYSVEDEMLVVEKTGELPTPEPTYPENMYLIGTINGEGWNPTLGAKMSNEGDGFYTIENVVLKAVDGNTGFAFVTDLAQNNDEGGWNYINGLRYGPKENDTEATLNVELPFEKIANSWTIKPGTYTFYISLDDMIVEIEGEADPETPEVPEAFYMISEANGWGEGIEMPYVKDEPNPAGENQHVYQVKGLTMNNPLSFALSQEANAWVNKFGCAENGEFTKANTLQAKLNGGNFVNATNLTDITLTFYYNPTGESWLQLEGTEPNELELNFTATNFELEDADINNLVKIVDNYAMLQSMLSGGDYDGVLDITSNPYTYKYAEGQPSMQLVFAPASGYTIDITLSNVPEGVQVEVQSGDTNDRWLVGGAIGSGIVANIAITKEVKAPEFFTVAFGASTTTFPAYNPEGTKLLPTEENSNIYEGIVAVGKNQAMAFFTDTQVPYTGTMASHYLGINMETYPNWPAEGNATQIAQAKLFSNEGVAADDQVKMYVTKFKDYPTSEKAADIKISINWAEQSFSLELMPYVEKAPDFYLWGSVNGNETITNMATFKKAANADVYTLENFVVPACGIFDTSDEFGATIPRGFSFIINESNTSSKTDPFMPAYGKNEINLTEAEQEYTAEVSNAVRGDNFLVLNPGVYNFTFDYEKMTFTAELVTPYKQVQFDIVGAENITNPRQYVTAMTMVGEPETLKFPTNSLLFSYEQSAGVLFALNEEYQADYTLTVTGPTGIEPGENTYMIDGNTTGFSSGEMVSLLGVNNGTFTITVAEKPAEPAVLYFAQPFGTIPATNPQTLEETESGVYEGVVKIAKGLSYFGFYSDVDGVITKYSKGNFGSIGAMDFPYTDEIIENANGVLSWYITAYPTDCQGNFTVTVDLNTMEMTIEPVFEEAPAPANLYLFGTTGGYMDDARFTNMGTFSKAGDVFTLENFEVPACGIFTADGEFTAPNGAPNYGFYFYLNDTNSNSNGNMFGAPTAAEEGEANPALINLTEGNTYETTSVKVQNGQNFIALNPGVYTMTFDWATKTFTATLNEAYNEVTIKFVSENADVNPYRLVQATNVLNGESITFNKLENLYSYSTQGAITFVPNDGYTLEITCDQPQNNNYVINSQDMDDQIQTTLGFYAGANGYVFTVTVEPEIADENVYYLGIAEGQVPTEPDFDYPLTLNEDGTITGDYTIQPGQSFNIWYPANINQTNEDPEFSKYQPLGPASGEEILINFNSVHSIFEGGLGVTMGYWTLDSDQPLDLTFNIDMTTMSIEVLNNTELPALNALVFDDWTMYLKETETTAEVPLYLDMDETISYAGVQFLFTLPVGIEFKGIEFNDAIKMAGAPAVNTDDKLYGAPNTTSILAYFSQPTNITEDIATITVASKTGEIEAGTYDVDLKVVIFSNASGSDDIVLPDYTGKVTIEFAEVPATGVEIESVTLNEPSFTSQTGNVTEVTQGESVDVTVVVTPDNSTDVIKVTADNGATVTKNEDGTWTVDTSGVEVAEGEEVTVTITATARENVEDTYTITVKGLLLGDSNANGKVTVADVVTTANYIVEKPINNFCWPNANVITNDEDAPGERNGISVQDVTATVNIVLDTFDGNRNPQNIRRQANRYASNDRLVASNFKAGQNVIAVDLENNAQYSAIQATIELPAGMKVESVAVGQRAANHDLVYNVTGNELHVILFSYDNSNFTNGEGSLFNITVKADENSDDLVIKNILASDAASNGYELSFEGGLYSEATGIDGIGAEGADVRYFTVDGIEVFNPEKGQILIRVQNGEATKVLVK